MDIRWKRAIRRLGWMTILLLLLFSTLVWVARGANLVTPNLDEVRRLLGRHIEPNSIAEHGAELLARLGARAVLTTLDRHGMLLLRARHAPLRLPAQSSHCVDPTGAGDTVIAAMSVAYAVGSGLTEAAHFAAHAAACAVTEPGTTTVGLEPLAATLPQETPLEAWGS